MKNDIYVIQDALSHQISEPFVAPNEPTALRIFDRAISSARLPKKLRADTDLYCLGSIEVADDGRIFLRGFDFGQRIVSASDPCFDEDDDDDDKEVS